MHPSRILIVEDDPGIRKFLRVALEDEGYAVFEADSVKRGLIEAASRQPALLVVDLGLPDGDGKQLIRELRSWSSAGVLVLSARDREAEKVEALDAGADDYLAKPFGVSELLARVRVQLRHREGAQAPAAEHYVFGPVAVDLRLREVRRDDAAVHLTPTEFRLLSVLLRHHGRVLTYRQLLQTVWGPNHVEREHYVRIYMANLRQKLERDPAQPEYLLTELQVGYKLTGVSLAPDA